jgi:TPR repeat protein
MKVSVFSTILLLFSLALQAVDSKTTKKIAEQEDAEAQNNLGVMYHNGEGVIKNYKVAKEWYMKAANQGDAEAQHNLGYMYSNGEGVVEDYKVAKEWYTKAAIQGHAPSQYNLGVMYYNGEGVVEDFVLSYAWLSNAKAHGQKTASEAISMVREKMTKEQIALGQALATKLYQQLDNGDHESPVHTKYD